MARTIKPRTPVLSAVILLAAALALSACTAEQFWRSVYETGKNACQHHLGNCSDHTEDHWN